MTKQKKLEVELSSGNVFADLGLPNAEQEQLKAHLTLQIYRTIKDRGLTQTQAGAMLGLKQPHVSLLMRNRSGSFSVGTDDAAHEARSGCPDYRPAEAAQSGRTLVYGQITSASFSIQLAGTEFMRSVSTAKCPRSRTKEKTWLGENGRIRK